MKKFKENNPIDIIEALCRMGDTENVGKFEMPWSDDNSEQIEQNQIYVHTKFTWRICMASY